MNKTKKILLIMVVCIIITIVYKSHWLYLDAAGFPLNKLALLVSNFSYLTSFATTPYFGVDVTYFTSSRLIQGLLFNLSQYGVYFLYFIFCFCSAYFLLKLKFSKTTSIYGALIFTFNPISIHFLQEIGYLFAYFCLPLIIFAIYKYFTDKKIIYILLSCLGFYFLISYTRITGICALFLVLIGIYYFSFIKNILKNKKKQLIIFIGTHILLFAPFLFAFIFPYFSGEKAYFSGVGNYATSFMAFGSAMYHSIANEGFWNGFIVKGLIGNFDGVFQKTLLFSIGSILFIIGIFIYANFINKKIKNSLINYLSCIFLGLIFIRIGAKFMPESLFIDIAYTYFPFIANSTLWLYMLYIPIIVYLFTFSLEHTEKHKNKYILIVFGCTYMFLSLFPLLNYKNNPKLATINIKKIPINYQNTFYKETIEKNASLFIPSSNIYFNWSEYPFTITNNVLYQTLFKDDLRLVNSKQLALNEMVSSGNNEAYIANNALFNLKNIFVFKDIRNAEVGQFDFYPIDDYVGKSKIYYEKFKINTGIYIKQDNENFAQFGFKDDNNYNFFIYAPKTIVSTNMKDFFATPLDIYGKPVIIDPTSFHKPQVIRAFTQSGENENIHIDVKSSLLNATKYYIKITNVDTSKPFIIHMNQTFGVSWKIKRVDKKYFDTKPCINEIQEYSITQNSNCEYQINIFERKDINLLHKPEANNSNHFEGNYIGNTWIISPEDIPQNMQGEKALYAVIIYEKQIYYTYTLLIAGCTFLLLIVIGMIQEIKKNKSKGYTSNKHI